MRFTKEHVEQWREEGFVVIERFFTAQEVEPVRADFERLHPPTGGATQVPRKLREGDDRAANQALQFKNLDVLPYAGGPAINLISMHPEIIAFARAALEGERVHLYQSHTWAKFTGEADYDQDFHCDFGNHTLVVPSEESRRRTADFVMYFTDVTEEHGALRYVPKSEVLALAGEPLFRVPPHLQQALRERERAVVGPAGTLLVHGIDTVHRASNLTAVGGRRYSMTAGYKAAGNDLIGFHVWQERPGRPWENVFNHARPEQLACLGIPPPGDSFWTPRTLRETQARWPGWDMRDYFARCPR